MDWIGQLLNSTGLAVGVVLLFAGFLVFSFVKGWVQPKPQVESVLTIANGRTADANARAEEWREAYFTERQKNEVLVKLVEQLTVVGQTTDKILKALPPMPREEE